MFDLSGVTFPLLKLEPRWEQFMRTLDFSFLFKGRSVSGSSSGWLLLHKHVFVNNWKLNSGLETDARVRSEEHSLIQNALRVLN